MGRSKERYMQMTVAEILDEEFGAIDYSFLKRIKEEQWQQQEESHHLDSIR